MAKSFHELSSRAQTIVFGLLCGLTMVGAWQMLIGPAQAELASQRAQARDDSRATSRARRRPRTSCRSCSAKSPALEAALRETTAVLPDEKDPQDVLRNLHDLASESSLDIASFKPKAIVTKRAVLRSGRSRSASRAVSRPRPLLRSDREHDAADVRVRPPDQDEAEGRGRGTVTATCLATTFVFQKDMGPTTPRPAPPSRRAGARARREEVKPRHLILAVLALVAVPAVATRRSRSDRVSATRPRRPDTTTAAGAIRS